MSKSITEHTKVISSGSRYTLDNLKFGKVDVGRFPELAKKFYINDTPFTKQLPTVIVFKNGEEFNRVPAIDSKGYLHKFIFNEVGFSLAYL